MLKNDKKIINAWCMYDWANSVYALTITTAVFPSYFYGVTGGKDGVVRLLGFDWGNSALYSFLISFAFLIVALLNPILSGMADYGGKKKQFMKLFVYLGSLSTLGLFFFDSNHIALGSLLFVLATVGFAGSLVFYNSFLPEIATEDRFDQVSAKGFALGYIGSVILLIFNLVMILQPGLFGIPVGEDGKALDTTIAPKVSFLTVGVWWMLFSQITFKRLPDNVFHRKSEGSLLLKGYEELLSVWQQVKTLGNLKRFLLSFFLFSMGVQTVMYLATIFGEEVVGMDMSELIQLVLILQLVAIGGAYFFSWLSKRKGNVFSLLTTLVIWIVICFSAYGIQEGMKLEYYGVGFLVGFVMGGVQSMSRSTYSKLIPEDTQDHASFFSFFETLEKVAISSGAFIYGMVMWVTGRMNDSALILALFFVAGFLILRRVRVTK